MEFSQIWLGFWLDKELMDNSFFFQLLLNYKVDLSDLSQCQVFQCDTMKLARNT